MSERSRMKRPASVAARAETFFERNWRSWAQELFESGTCNPALNVSLDAPRERDVTSREGMAAARSWIKEWREADTCESVEWQTRSWARLGDQKLPVRIKLESAETIARWARKEDLWATAKSRISDARTRLATQLCDLEHKDTSEQPGAAVRTCIRDWCALSDADWQRALDTLEWLLAHPETHTFVRQLPIRGIDTKWVETHSACIRPLYRSLTCRDFAFAQAGKLFRCKACDGSLNLAGCTEFALSASELDKLEIRPSTVLICENLVNVLCLDGFKGVLALHGSGFAVTDLAAVSWLRKTPLVYWGDLDSNGFAILNALRGFAPHARSVMMDCATLERYRDLCVEEPMPHSGKRQSPCFFSSPPY